MKHPCCLWNFQKIWNRLILFCAAHLNRTLKTGNQSWTLSRYFWLLFYTIALWLTTWLVDCLIYSECYKAIILIALWFPSFWNLKCNVYIVRNFSLWDYKILLTMYIELVLWPIMLIIPTSWLLQSRKKISVSGCEKSRSIDSKCKSIFEDTLWLVVNWISEENFTVAQEIE